MDFGTARTGYRSAPTRTLTTLASVLLAQLLVITSAFASGSWELKAEPEKLFSSAGRLLALKKMCGQNTSQLEQLISTQLASDSLRKYKEHLQRETTATTSSELFSAVKKLGYCTSALLENIKRDEVSVLDALDLVIPDNFLPNPEEGFIEKQILLIDPALIGDKLASENPIIRMIMLSRRELTEKHIATTKEHAEGFTFSIPKNWKRTSAGSIASYRSGDNATECSVAVREPDWKLAPASKEEMISIATKMGKRERGYFLIKHLPGGEVDSHRIIADGSKGNSTLIHEYSSKNGTYTKQFTMFIDDEVFVLSCATKDFPKYAPVIDIVASSVEKAPKKVR